MAYVIVVCDDNTLRNSNKERIMQRSKLVDNLYILVPPIYKEHKMSQYTVMLEYVLPISKRYRSEILVLSDEGYEEYLKYTLPFDTALTSEAGEIELQLTFACVDLDENGNSVQRVRKTSTTKINIVPISAWSDIIPDSALSALDQRIIKVDAQIKALDDINNNLNNTKADNIIYEDNRLQLTANGNKIGDSVDIQSSYDDCVKDGVPVVDFGNSTDFVTPDDSVDSNKLNNIIEF